MTNVDVSSLPYPQVLESLDFERVFARLKNNFIDLQDPSDKSNWHEALSLESHIITKQLQAVAYLELLLRSRINDAAKSTMVAHASGANLDNLAANFNIVRLVIKPADLTAIPPVVAIYESDERLRERILSVFDSITTAGSIGSYKWHTLSTDAKVADVNVTSDVPGRVIIAIIERGRLSNPLTSPSLIKKITKQLNAEHIRPLCDTVKVIPASLVRYRIIANIKLLSSQNETSILAKINANLSNFTKNLKIGMDITPSQIISQIQVFGVHSVSLTAPVNTIKVNNTSVAICDSIAITVGGYEH